MSDQAYVLLVLTFVLIGVGLGMVIGILASRMAVRHTGADIPTRARIGLQALALAAAAWVLPTGPLAFGLYLYVHAFQPGDTIVSIIAIPVWVAIVFLCPSIGLSAGITYFAATSTRLSRAARKSNE